jgi:hypothetical protein
MGRESSRYFKFASSQYILNPLLTLRKKSVNSRLSLPRSTTTTTATTTTMLPSASQPPLLGIDTTRNTTSLPSWVPPPHFRLLKEKSSTGIFALPDFDPSLLTAFESVSYFPSKSTLTSSCNACWAPSPPDVPSPQLLKQYASCLSLPTADRDDRADKASGPAHYRGRP